jgi:fructose-bisphosphate aldolase class II
VPVVPTREILARAFAERYGVAAFNVINDLSMEAVLAAAEELKAPVILQTSVKHVKMTGLDAMYAMWVAYTKDISVPVALHLDHCPERDVISACLAKGWSSVLFDASKLSVEENQRQCIEVVAEAPLRRRRRGEIGLQRTEEMTGDEAASEAGDRRGLRQATGVDVFAPPSATPRTLQRRPDLDSPASPISSRPPASRSPSTAAPA